MVVLLNILVALYSSAYSDVTEDATDEYMALFAQKAIQFVRAPDENGTLHSMRTRTLTTAHVIYLSEAATQSPDLHTHVLSLIHI